MKSRVHEVTVKIRFDRPTSRTHAVSSFRDNVHGTFYPVAYDETYPGTFKITSVRTGRWKPS